jgi:hypothetical protein
MTALDTGYAAAMGAVDLGADDYEARIATMFRTYYENKVAAEEAPAVDPEAVVVPHFVRDGVRTLARLGAWLERFYMVHKSTIDPILDAALIQAFTVLGTRAAEIANLNNRGPT